MTVGHGSSGHHDRTVGQAVAGASVAGGLPWAAFTAGRRRELLGAVEEVLTPGMFVAFAFTASRWMPPIVRLRLRWSRLWTTARTTPVTKEPLTGCGGLQRIRPGSGAP
ncbi:hypothetical protein [Micromonospora haikouensis]|uniref:hypothetical protein n=1 Tax=Micromonospora haikouensis TaxID=686309 RepID=UPI003788F3DD